MTRAPEYYELATDVELLYTTYCEALDDAELERWPSFFTNDCLYRIATRENHERGLPLSFVLCSGQAMLRDRTAAIQKAVMYRRRFQRRIVSGIRLKTWRGLDEEGIETCASFVVYESIGNNPSGLLACGRSLDVIVRDGDALKFKQRLCVIDAQVMPDSLVLPI
jgi:3-phenylpropionate/cinnamic acid dioxygenase small subunit